MSKWDEQEVIYLAGFLDGEGCFTVSGNTCLIQVSSAHFPTLEWLRDVFGGFLSKPKKKVREHHKTLRQWRIAGKPAIELANSIIPYLKEKKTQAELLIAIQETHGSGGRLTNEIVLKRQTLVKELRECKEFDYV